MRLDYESHTDSSILNVVPAAHASKTRSVAELFTAADNSGQKSDKEAQQVLLRSSFPELYHCSIPTDIPGTLCI